MSNPPADHEPTDFGVFITELNRGAVCNELTAALNEVVRAVESTGRMGKITLSLKVYRPKNNEQVIQIADDVKVTVPAFDRKESFWFTDGNGGLTRDDPNQTALQFNNVAALNHNKKD